MKTTSVNIKTYNAFRILFIVSLFALISIAHPVVAQQDNVKTSALYPGFGIGLAYILSGRCEQVY